MITQVRIDGFKSFLDFHLDVPESLILLGPNGSGKSNLFDALRLAAGVVRHGLDETLAADRRLATAGLFHLGGERGELRRDRAVIEVGMLVPAWDGPVPLRLQVKIGSAAHDGSEAQLPVLDGRSAVSVDRSEEWMASCGLSDAAQSEVRRAREDFLRRMRIETSTLRRLPVGAGVVTSEQESQEDRTSEGYPLSPLANEFSALVAREVRGWQSMLLDPDAMRGTVPARPNTTLAPDGSGLAAVLARLFRQTPEVWRRLVADAAGLITGLRDIRPQLLDRREEFDFEVEFEHTGWVAPPLLSDGTLRALGLLTAAADPLRPGVLCVEEIENGMHPAHVADLVRRLRRDDGVQPGSSGPYRQLLATTHSPALLAALRSDFDHLVFLEQVRRTQPSGTLSRVTRARPLLDDGPEEPPGERVSPDQVARMLRRFGREAA